MEVADDDDDEDDGDDEEKTPFFLCQRRILLRAMSQASSFNITSQRPSLAKMRHSSSLVRGTIVTSGSGIIDGFKYLSPAFDSRKLTVVHL